MHPTPTRRLHAAWPLLALCAALGSSAWAATTSANRPNLNATNQADYTKAKYLARAGTIGALKTDNWLPTGAGDTASFKAKYTVAADGTGTHRSVQAAINAASGSSRVYIAVKPGTYREVVCVPANKPPITLYGTHTDAAKTVIVFNNAAPKPKGSSTAANPCTPNTGMTTYGMNGSATFTVFAKEFHAKNLSFSNDYKEGTYASSGQQAVAMMTQGDRIIFDNTRFLGNQDTLFLSTNGYNIVARTYVRASFVQGDVDFIYGRGTAVFEGSTIQYLSGVKGNGGNHIAPATAAGNPYGFLFQGGRFTADSGTGTNAVSIGRSWDEGVSTGMYRAGSSPNGQAVIREATLDKHIKLTAPWGASTSGRAFSPSGSRLREYKNTGAGS